MHEKYIFTFKSLFESFSSKIKKKKKLDYNQLDKRFCKYFLLFIVGNEAVFNRLVIMIEFASCPITEYWQMIRMNKNIKLIKTSFDPVSFIFL